MFQTIKEKKIIIDWFGYSLLFIIISITIFGLPLLNNNNNNSSSGESNIPLSIYTIWYYGWITAVCTGLGVIPFFFVNQPNKHWMGISNGKEINFLLPFISFSFFSFFPFLLIIIY